MVMLNKVSMRECLIRIVRHAKGRHRDELIRITFNRC